MACSGRIIKAQRCILNMSSESGSVYKLQVESETMSSLSYCLGFKRCLSGLSRNEAIQRKHLEQADVKGSILIRPVLNMGDHRIQIWRKKNRHYDTLNLALINY